MRTAVINRQGLAPFLGCPSVRVLDLSKNRIATIEHGWLLHLASLEMLSLSSNLLSELPAMIFAGLPALTELYLNNNDIKAVGNGAFPERLAQDGQPALRTIEMGCVVAKGTENPIPKKFRTTATCTCASVIRAREKHLLMNNVNSTGTTPQCAALDSENQETE